MPRIKQERMRLELDPKHKWRETVVYTYYDNTNKDNSTYHKPVPSDNERFYVKIPEVIANALGKDKSFGSNQEEAMAAFKVDLEAFKSMSVATNKVILYEIKTNPSVNERYKYQGYKVDVWMAAYVETVTTDGVGGKRYTYEFQDSPIKFPTDMHGDVRMPVGHHQGNRCDTQVPWTKQNEAFFVWVCENMAELASRLDEITQPDIMLETINAGRLLPLGEVKHDAKP